MAGAMPVAHGDHAREMTTGNSGFLEVEPLTEGDTTPPSLQMISLSDGANSNASTRCASAIPGRKDQMSDDYGREGSWVEDALISVNAMLYPLRGRSARVRTVGSETCPTHMQERGPATKVILHDFQGQIEMSDVRITHVFANTFGMCASATLAGSCPSHRSGFHSCASGPQISLSRLRPRMFTHTIVYAGTTSSVIVRPSVP